MVKALFWTSLSCIGYVYVGYPLLLMLWRRVAQRPVHKRYREPSVSLIVAMHNERKNARRKIENCFELDYPADKLQVIVSLDAPTDGTDDVVREYVSRGVNVVCSPVRRGKSAALNSGVAMATGDILLFADARQRFDKSAIRELVANFADEAVGSVSGELFVLDEEGKEASDAVGAYWRYEKKLRAMESEIHSVPGASGAIYAIRRELFVPLDPDTILDDVVIPMRIVLGGKRSIFEPAARAYDLASQNPELEYERKTRTLTGNYQLFAHMPELLVPWRNPIFVQLISHKLGRLLVPYCLAALLISNLFLLRGFYMVVFVCQIFWYGLAASGRLLSTSSSESPARQLLQISQGKKGI
jgi:biofilm PGA synthesis N-glycosyltransferase PgaC